MDLNFLDELNLLPEVKERITKEINAYISQIDRERKIDILLMQAHARNIVAVAALIDPNNPDIQAQIDAIRKSDPYLFESDKANINNDVKEDKRLSALIKGTSPTESTDINESSLTYADYITSR